MTATDHFAPRVALVTGSGSGIGVAVARRVARPGTSLKLHAPSNRAGCEATAEAVRSAGAQAKITLGDLSDPETASSLITRSIEAFGSLDVLVANAGFPILKGFGEVTAEDMDYSYRVISAGFCQMATAAMPYL